MTSMKNGFTLVEMLVVILILGLVASIVAVNVGGKVEPARVKATRALLTQLRQQVDLFRLDHARLPERIDDLWRRPSYVDSKLWPAGGYLAERVVDAWGRELDLVAPGSEGRPFELRSLGEDGRPSDDDLWSPAR